MVLARDIAVRVVKTTNAPHRLPKDLCLGELFQTEQLGAEPPALSSGPGVGTQPNTEAEVKVKLLEGDESDPMTELIKALPPELNNEHRAKAIDLLQRHESVFSRGEFDVGRTNLVSYRIPTGDAKPIRQPLRRHPTAYLQAIDDYIDQLQARHN